MSGLTAAVRRNTVILSLAMALSWSVIVLVAALTTVTAALLFGLPELAGLAFALYLLAYAAAGLVTGRAMDRWGRRNALIVAFLVGSLAAFVVYLGVGGRSLPLSLLGLLGVALGTGGANLARVAGADMYPPERRSRGIAFVLFGAALGSLGAPLLFGPLLAAARGDDAAALAAPWPIAGLVLLAGAVVLLGMRVDPQRISEELRAASAGRTAMTDSARRGARSLAELVALPMVPLALLAAVVAQAVMTSVMALAGLVLAEHGHDLGAVSITISSHFVGMFGLVLLVGPLVERVGRFRAVLLGLLILAAGVLLLLPGPELVNFIPGMFAVGVGWNVAFVASTAILADAARPTERGRLLGFSDFVAILAAAALSVLAGYILDVLGLPFLVLTGTLLSLVPAVVIGLNRRRLEGLA